MFNGRLRNKDLRRKVLEATKVLDLSENQLDDFDAGLIADALKETDATRFLEELLLSENEISDDGAIAIAGALRGNKSNLRKLDLGANKIGEMGAAALAVFGPEGSSSTVQQPGGT